MKQCTDEEHIMCTQDYSKDNQNFRHLEDLLNIALKKYYACTWIILTGNLSQIDRSLADIISKA